MVVFLMPLNTRWPPVQGSSSFILVFDVFKADLKKKNAENCSSDFLYVQKMERVQNVPTGLILTL